MPLRIKLPDKEKVIINGAVIENNGESTTLVIHNHADILRRKEVMLETEANTPASRTVFLLQNAYLFEADREESMKKFVELLKEYVDAAPSAARIAIEVLDHIKEKRLYKALRVAQKLLEHEEKLMKLAGNASRTPRE